MARVVRTLPERLSAIAARVSATGAERNKFELMRLLDEVSEASGTLTIEETLLVSALQAVHRIGQKHPNRKAVFDHMEAARLLVARQVTTPKVQFTGNRVREQREGGVP